MADILSNTSVYNAAREDFSDIEFSLFEYIVKTFPENVLIIDGQYSEDILALLATLAKAFGNSRELILNLGTAHSVKEIFEKIDGKYLNAAQKKEILALNNYIYEANNRIAISLDQEEINDITAQIEEKNAEIQAIFDSLAPYMEDNNKELVIPMASDLGYHRIPVDMETDLLIEKLIEEKPFIEDYYSLYKNRGTLVAVSQVMRKFAQYIGRSSLDYQVYETKDGLNLILPYLEEYIDFDNPVDFIYNDENISGTAIKKDTILYDMLMKIKPLGVTYNVLIDYLAYSMSNLTSDAVIRDAAEDNLQLSVVPGNDTLASLVVSGTDIASNYQGDESSYSVDIENLSAVSSFDVYVADWNISGYIASDHFSDLVYQWKKSESALTPHDDGLSKVYIFGSKEDMDRSLPFVQPSPAWNAMVTGYYWKVASASLYNASTDKIVINASTDKIIMPAQFLPEGDAPTMYELLQHEEYWPTSSFAAAHHGGSVGIKWQRITGVDGIIKTSYFVLVKATGTVPFAEDWYYYTGGNDEFSYSKVRIGPKKSKTVYRVSTDSSYDNLASYVGVYFTKNNDISSKSQTEVHQLVEGAGFTLSDPVLSAFGGMAASGIGYVQLSMRNSNSLDVQANVTRRWYSSFSNSLLDVQSTIYTVSAGETINNSSTRYYNTYGQTVRCEILVTFTIADLGQQSSATVVVYDIANNELLQSL